MARKRRAQSPPPPPPPPPQQSEEEEEEEEEESPRAPAPRNPPQTPQPPSAGSDSDSDTDAQAFQVRQVPRSPTKPESDDDGESSESEPLVHNRAPAKSKAEQERKRSAPESAASGKPKKAKMGKAEPEKATKGGAKLGQALHSSPSSIKSDKPARAMRTWTKDDQKKILEALAAHVKTHGALPKMDALLAAVRDRLDRKNCNYSDIYEKVRRLRERYEKAVATGTLPSKEDDLQMYNLSEAVWGEKVKEAAAAATSQNDGAVTKSSKGQVNKQKMDGNSKGGAPKEATAGQNGDTHKGSKKGQAIKGKTDGDVRSRLSKEATTTATPSKSKKQGNHKEESTTSATQTGTALTKSKSGKTDKEKIDRYMESHMPKEATTANQNGGILTKSKEGETHDEERERDANAQVMHRGFDELQKLYSNLAAFVEGIEAQHPCGETLKRAFQFIGDEKARILEYKIKKQRVTEAKAQIRRADIKKEVLNMLIGLVD